MQNTAPEKIKRYAILLKHWSQDIKLPLFEGLSLYNVSRFFFRGIIQGSVTSRAGSVAYSFFMALFPGIIFLFTLIPFFPVASLEAEIYHVFARVLPPDTWEASRTTIEDILRNKRGGLLSFGFFLALIFSTNGINALITNFSNTIHDVEWRPWWKQMLISLGLTFVISFNFIVGIILIIFSADVLNGLLGFFRLEEVSTLAVETTRFFLLLLLVYSGILILYNFGPARTTRRRLLSPGAILATFLIVLTSAGFSFYVANFSQYNKLYGSIGTLIVILLWIYLNALVLIIGFELNASISQIKQEQQHPPASSS